MQKRYVGGGLKGHTHRGLRLLLLTRRMGKNLQERKEKTVKNFCQKLLYSCSYVYSAELFFPKFFVCFIEKFD